MKLVQQVIHFIRASRESHSGELVLVVRPNGELGTTCVRSFAVVVWCGTSFACRMCVVCHICSLTSVNVWQNAAVFVFFVIKKLICFIAVVLLFWHGKAQSCCQKSHGSNLLRFMLTRIRYELFNFVSKEKLGEKRFLTSKNFATSLSPKCRGIFLMVA